MSAPEKNYKDTILLPETGFPMRGDLTKNEPVRLKKWEDTGLYERILSRRMAQGAPRFLLHDGPPFANGDVHMGTALNKILKDLVLKSKTMAGYAAPYIPGWDCHGLPIEFKVVQKARDLDAAEIRRRCAEFAKGFIDIQRTSFRRLGVFGDWENPYLTMKPAYEANILRVFAKLVEDGAVYQSRKPVQWSYGAYTALAEAEIDYKEKVSTSVFVRFPLLDNPLGLKASMVIWTTTPWTLPANVGLALHPRFTYVAGRFMKNGQTENLIIVKELLDAFAQKTGWALAETIREFKGAELENCEARHPFLSRTSTIILADFVTTDTGTGIVHIAPGHGADDYNVGRQYGLPVLSPVDDDGKYTEEVGVPSLVGKHVFDANKDIISMLEQGNNLFGVEEYRHQYPHCWRSKTPIIFRAVEQFFISMDKLRPQALEEIDKVQWLPSWGRNRIYGTVEARPDWCISRQIWWGHRIPVWYCDDCGKQMASRTDLTECPHCHSHNIHQDEDALDTWFSSGLWPFSTFGWPDKTDELQQFYPTSVLVTGYDIIFFWVARMITMGMEFMKEIPFKHVFIHGLVRDEQGRKMSKSLGNGIDPLEVVDKYGADTLRFMLITGNTPGNDMRFYWNRIEATRNFANKIWNASRFALMNLDGYDASAKRAPLTLADRWILSRLQHTIKDVSSFLEKFELGEAGRLIYDFIWGEVCDWYIELIKPRLYDKEHPEERSTAQFVLCRVLGDAMKLLHPYMPFITEEIWQHLPHEGESIMIAPWPVADESLMDESVESGMTVMMDAIKAIRNMRAEVNAAPGKKAPATILVEPAFRSVFEGHPEYVERLGTVDTLTLGDINDEAPENAMTAVVTGAKVYLPLKGLIDVEKEMKRLTKELDGAKKELSRIEGKLSNEGFLAKAPEAVVEKEKAKKEDVKARLTALEDQLKELQKLQ